METLKWLILGGIVVIAVGVYVAFKLINRFKGHKEIYFYRNWSKRKGGD